MYAIRVVSHKKNPVDLWYESTSDLDSEADLLCDFRLIVECLGISAPHP